MTRYTHYAAAYPEGGIPLLRILEKAETIRNQWGPDYYVAPAKDFESAQNVTDISAQWHMPKGYDERKLQNELADKKWLLVTLKEEKQKLSTNDRLHPIIDDLIEKTSSDNHAFVNKVYDELLRLNPKLANIKIDKNDMNAVEDIVWGAISQFNTYDIDFYIRDQSAGHALRNDSSYKALKRKMGNSDAWEWIPSPETMEKVASQLQGRKLKYISPPLNPGIHSWSRSGKWAAGIA